MACCAGVTYSTYQFVSLLRNRAKLSLPTYEKIRYVDSLHTLFRPSRITGTGECVVRGPAYRGRCEEAAAFHVEGLQSFVFGTI